MRDNDRRFTSAVSPSGYGWRLHELSDVRPWPKGLGLIVRGGSLPLTPIFMANAAEIFLPLNRDGGRFESHYDGRFSPGCYRHRVVGIGLDGLPYDDQIAIVDLPYDADDEA